MPPNVTRVLIAADDDLMRAGLIELLTADPTIEIVGQAATGRHVGISLPRRGGRLRRSGEHTIDQRRPR